MSMIMSSDTLAACSAVASPERYGYKPLVAAMNGLMRSYVL
jgi:hypothetical protein